MPEYYDKKCECGCGESIPIKPCHKSNGIPDYLIGHNMRVNNCMKNPETARKNAEENRRRHHNNRCGCGCGQFIKPGNKYLQGHNMRDPEAIKKKSEENKVKNLFEEIKTKRNYNQEVFMWDSTSIFYCKCGCQGLIEIKPHHKYRGIPDYILGHWSGIKKKVDAKAEEEARGNEISHFWKQHGKALILYKKDRCCTCNKGEDELEFSLRIHPLGSLDDMSEENWVTICSICKGLIQ